MKVCMLSRTYRWLVAAHWRREQCTQRAASWFIICLLNTHLYRCPSVFLYSLIIDNWKKFTEMYVRKSCWACNGNMCLWWFVDRVFLLVYCRRSQKTECACLLSAPAYILPSGCVCGRTTCYPNAKRHRVCFGHPPAFEPSQIELFPGDCTQTCTVNGC